MKHVVTISRKWNNPHIDIFICEEEISLKMSMEDFETALLEEIGSVATTLTKNGFKKKLRSAINNVISGIKEESIKAV